MTQKKSEPLSHPLDESEQKKSTRIESMPPDLFDPTKPRLGRRESEPHSAEVTYIHDVLTLNFPNCRALWDLHHYFLGKKGVLQGKKIDIQFDISFFKDLHIPYTLSSYDARKYDNRIPDMAINVLSKTTWKTDLSENVDICKNLEIPVYILFSPYNVTSNIYRPPFLRVFILENKDSYRQEDLRNITLIEGEELHEKNIIDVGNNLPFRLGLMQLKQQHEGDLPLFRLIFIDKSELKIIPSKIEKLKEAETKAKEAETKAKEAETKAKEAETKAKEAETKTNQFKKELNKYRDKFGQLE